jgi:putative methyltransferase (TIGR04325 family)
MPPHSSQSPLQRVAKNFTPQKLARFFRKLARLERELPGWEYVGRDWRNPAAQARGWNMASVLEVYKSNWPQFLKSVGQSAPLALGDGALTPTDVHWMTHHNYVTYGYVLALAARNKPRLSLLDWGGGIGQYYVLSQALLPGVEIDYVCKDVPVLCAHGRKLFPEATFVDNEADLAGRKFDLVLASGALHFSEDWRAVAALLASLSGDYLFLTRLPVVQQGPPFVVLQRASALGYGTEFLCWFLNRRELLEHMAKQRLHLVREFLGQERPAVRNAPEQGEYRGFLYQPAR